MEVERLREVVVGRDGDVSSRHFRGGEHTVGHEHEADVLINLFGLYPVAQFASRHSWHFLLRHHDVRMQHFKVVVCHFSAVVGIYIIYITQSLLHKLEEVLVGVDDDDGVLLCDESCLSWSYHVGSELLVGAFEQVHLAAVVKLQSLVGHSHSL